MLDVGIERLIAFRQRVEQRAALLLGVRAKGVLQRHEAAEPGRADLGAVVQARHRVIPDGHGLGLDVQQPTVVDHHHQRHDGQDDQEAGEDALAQSQILHAGGPCAKTARSVMRAAPRDVPAPLAATLAPRPLRRCSKIQQLLQSRRRQAMKIGGQPPIKPVPVGKKQSSVTTGLSFSLSDRTEAGSPAPVLAPFNRPRAPSAAGPTPSPAPARKHGPTATRRGRPGAARSAAIPPAGRPGRSRPAR